jgi:hypothetical protein
MSHAGTVIVAIICTFASHAASACSCFGPSLANEFRSSAAVFVGTVTYTQRANGGLLTKFKIDRTWKGPAAGAVITTWSPPSDCYRPFDVGCQYVVFVDTSSGDPVAGYLCSNTKALKPNYSLVPDITAARRYLYSPTSSSGPILLSRGGIACR